MKEIIDDKAQYVVPFILKRLEAHQQRYASSNPDPQAAAVAAAPPFIIGLNGVQGAGKSVLVGILQKTLRSPPYNLSTVVFSLDDLYLTHEDQVALAAAHPHNPLLQHRGQPKTHDVALAIRVFEDLKAGKPTKIPQYNKAAFSGQGDRVPESEWEEMNSNNTGKDRVQVILFEGWCVGFRPIASDMLRDLHEAAARAAHAPDSSYPGRLGHNSLQSVTDINEALEKYDAITDQFDAFVHIDAQDPLYVYRWRSEQERGLWETKGAGMTEEQVKYFVDGYYPAYELYTEPLRQGVFNPRHGRGAADDWHRRQMRLVVGADRKVKQVIEL